MTTSSVENRHLSILRHPTCTFRDALGAEGITLLTDSRPLQTIPLATYSTSKADIRTRRLPTQVRFNRSDQPNLRPPSVLNSTAVYFHVFWDITSSHASLSRNREPLRLWKTDKKQSKLYAPFLKKEDSTSASETPEGMTQVLQTTLLSPAKENTPLNWRLDHIRFVATVTLLQPVEVAEDGVTSKWEPELFFSKAFEVARVHLKPEDELTLKVKFNLAVDSSQRFFQPNQTTSSFCITRKGAEALRGS